MVHSVPVNLDTFAVVGMDIGGGDDGGGDDADVRGLARDNLLGGLREWMFFL